MIIYLKGDEDSMITPHKLNYLEGSQRYRPFSYSQKESQSNDILLQFVEFSNIHNSDRSSNATRSNFGYKNVEK